MYSEVGKKIMGLAKACGWITFICGVIIWVIIIADGNSYNNMPGWIWLGIGVLSFISSWPLYGFGQLIDDVHAMRERSSEPVATPDDELPDL